MTAVVDAIGAVRLRPDFDWRKIFARVVDQPAVIRPDLFGISRRCVVVPDRDLADVDQHIREPRSDIGRLRQCSVMTPEPTQRSGGLSRSGLFRHLYM